MTVLDDRLLPVALDLLSRFGKDLTYRIPKVGEYDPIDGDVLRGSPDEFANVKSLPPGDFRKFFATDSVGIKSELQTGVAGLNIVFTPALNMQVVIDGKTYIAVDLMPIYSGELIIALWLFALKRGG